MKITAQNTAMYEVTKQDTGDLVMIAPLETIAKVYSLAPPAQERIRRNYEHCELFFARRFEFPTLVTRQVNVEVK